MDAHHVPDKEIAIAGAQLSSLQSKNTSEFSNTKASDITNGKNQNDLSIASENYMMPRRDSIGFVNTLGDALFGGHRGSLGLGGRRASLGLGGRRASLGLDGRRSSLGFGGDLSMDMGLGAGSMMARRGSMDSVVDAAIQNLANRRLSMLGASAHPMNGAGMNGMGGGPGISPLGMNAMMGIQKHGIGGTRSGTSGLAMSSQMNQFLMNGLGLTHAMNNIAGSSYSTDGGDSLHGNNTIFNGAQNSDSIINSNTLRQKQLQEQRLELQLRQKELEIQRQQLVSAMEERKLAMEQMQQSMQQQQIDLNSYVPAERRHSLFGGKVGAFAGPLGIEHLNGTSGSNQLGNPSGGNFHMCKFCNSKTYATAEEALACENVCRVKLENKWHQDTGIIHHDQRRGSLDLLGALAGVTKEVESSNTATNDSVDSKNPSSSATVDKSDNSGYQKSMAMLNAEDESNFATMKQPIPLGLPADKDWLTPLHCFVRLHCVEVFTATKEDVAVPTKGKRKPIHVGQVGIRCPHCHNSEAGALSRERGSVYYPTSVSSIYNATMNLLQRHLHSCNSVKPDIMKKYETLKSDDARSGTSKKYWAQSARSLGLVDTNEGIRFSNRDPPPLPKLTSEQRASDNYSAVRGNDDEFFNSDSNALMKQSKSNVFEASKTPDGLPKLGMSDNPLGLDDTMTRMTGANSEETEKSLSNSSPLVTPEDEKCATQFSFYLLGQMQMCVFTEADRLGKRKGLPPGFPGLACRHCFGGYGSGRFFPSSIKTLSDTSKTLNVLFNHMMRCRKCPQEVRDTLEKLRKVHDEQRAKMKFGSQKAFFARIWDRLHDNDPTVDARKRKFNQPKKKTKASRPTPREVQSSAVEKLKNMQAGGTQMLQNQYLDATNSFSGGLGGLSQAGLLSGFAVGGMFQGSNPFGTAGTQYKSDPGSNKRLKLQDLNQNNFAV